MHHDLTVTDQIYINFEDHDRAEAIQRISACPLNSQPVDRCSKRVSSTEADFENLLNGAINSEQSIELLAQKIIAHMDKRARGPSRSK
jgi:hypothetical protein